MNPIEVLIRENIELIGWIASGIILFSFLFDGIKLRLINSVGASTLVGMGDDNGEWKHYLFKWMHIIYTHL